MLHQIKSDVFGAYPLTNEYVNCFDSLVAVYEHAKFIDYICDKIYIRSELEYYLEHSVGELCAKKDTI